MKELTKEVTEVYAYQAEDGKIFSSKEECEKYENSAYSVIKRDFEKLKLAEYSECDVFENQGYGSEDYMYWLVEIKDSNDLFIANRFSEIAKSPTRFGFGDMGKKLLVGMGYYWEGLKVSCIRSYDDIIAEFTKDMNNIFLMENQADSKEKEKDGDE